MTGGVGVSMAMINERRSRCPVCTFPSSGTVRPIHHFLFFFYSVEFKKIVLGVGEYYGVIGNRDSQQCRDELVIHAGTYTGALLVDGLGDGVMLEAPDQDFEFLRNTSFNLLQGCRMRNTKTEYVSCPSCGRTLFDLQEISAEIREKTSHLPGVSFWKMVQIAIMGCIVNGPGKMADADFDYHYKKTAPLESRWGILKIPRTFSLGIFRGDFRRTGGPRSFLGNLIPRNSVGKFRGISEENGISEELFPRTCFVVLNFVGQTVVKRGIAMSEATDALIGLIKEHDRWVDPPVADE
ncbi:hypothetical protein DY000_02018136 [Brassica cretica]|uniref:IspG C-terminal domain-containing protein n=1 Tax=Brassica cretica TaxID=69181 RepID=A0ABQ7D8F9_BRACR|nr:hypothetical protein DY000_02018136 [Brassica cretica]